jgi:hypothetical protein
MMSKKEQKLRKLRKLYDKYSFLNSYVYTNKDNREPDTGADQCSYIFNLVPHKRALVMLDLTEDEIVTMLHTLYEIKNEFDSKTEAKVLYKLKQICPEKSYFVDDIRRLSEHPIFDKIRRIKLYSSNNFSFCELYVNGRLNGRLSLHVEKLNEDIKFTDKKMVNKFMNRLRIIRLYPYNSNQLFVGKLIISNAITSLLSRTDNVHLNNSKESFGYLIPEILDTKWYTHRIADMIYKSVINMTISLAKNTI